MEETKFCNGCIHLSLTEGQQNRLKRNGEYKDHICKVYNKRVVHAGWHPSIMRLNECDSYEVGE